MLAKHKAKRVGKIVYSYNYMQLAGSDLES